MKVTITEAERRELASLAHGRNASKHPNATRRKSDVFDDVTLDTLGLYGEFAASKVLGCSIDRSISGSGDSGHDLHWQGKTVAVKYNHRINGFLMVEARDGDNYPTSLHDLKSDIIVLVHGTCQPPNCSCRQRGTINVHVAGWLSREDFLERCFLKDLGLGNRYIVTADRLRPMSELMQPNARCRCRDNYADVWVDRTAKRAGWIATHCKLCDRWIGNRPMAA